MKLIKRLETKNEAGLYYYLFKCESCGEIVVRNHSGKKNKSCGCIGKQKGILRNKNKRLYECWTSMKSRATYSSHHSAHRYIDRGISLCEEWKSFDSFCIWSKCNGYDDNLTLDRIDNDKGYYPSNCRWVTKAENNRNRSTVKLNIDKIKQIRCLSNDGKTSKELSIMYGVSISHIHNIKNNKSWYIDKNHLEVV